MVTVLAIVMGLNLFGCCESLFQQVPIQSIGASCRLGWHLWPQYWSSEWQRYRAPQLYIKQIVNSSRPLMGMALLDSFGIGQVVSLLIAGTFETAVHKLLALQSVGRWVPPISDVVLLSTGLLNLITR